MGKALSNPVSYLACNGTDKDCYIYFFVDIQGFTKDIIIPSKSEFLNP
jgi:hypothetical protein